LTPHTNTLVIGDNYLSYVGGGYAGVYPGLTVGGIRCST
jgi:hypothetical protein